jgi:methylenetetrahydrofolate reductase (NADPH)
LNLIDKRKAASNQHCYSVLLAKEVLMDKTAASTLTLCSVACMLTGYSIELNPRDSKAIESAERRLDPGTEVFFTWVGGKDPIDVVAPSAQLRRAGLFPVPHIGAREIDSREQLSQLASRLAQAGVDRALVIGADRPHPAGPYDSSLAVIESGILQDAGIVRIAVGGFPEGNPHIPNLDLIELLRRKVEFGRNHGLQMSIVTQFCFAAAPIAAWLGRVRAAGIDVPVRLGLAGPAGIITLTRYALRCGVGKSLHVLAENPAFAKLLVEKGPEPLVRDLVAALCVKDRLPAGIAGLHFFVFGGFNKTVDWIETMR